MMANFVWKRLFYEKKKSVNELSEQELGTLMMGDIIIYKLDQLAKTSKTL